MLGPCLPGAPCTQDGGQCSDPNAPSQKRPSRQITELGCVVGEVLDTGP
jgi:hypothetical protein